MVLVVLVILVGQHMVSHLKIMLIRTILMI